MEKKYILSLFQEITNSRAVIFDKNENILGRAEKKIKIVYPQSGWVEQDPIEIWESQNEALKEAIRSAGISCDEIAAIGIANQRETTVVWDKNSGEPIYNAISWQCKRTAPICEDIKNNGMGTYIKKTTGLIVDAYFSATKLKWILDNVDGARQRAEKGELLFGTIDTWLIWKLTNGKVHVTDYTNASRTMIYDVKELKWDDKILEALEIPKSMLPEVKNSSGVCGYASLEEGKECLMPIAGLAGDQQAALFGHRCFKLGEAQNTYGTACDFIMNTGDNFVEAKSGLITTIAVGIEGKIEYALEGIIYIAGEAIEWIKDELGLIDAKVKIEDIKVDVDDNHGIYMVPAFIGLGAPYWDMYARGAIMGIARGVNKEHIIRAALESIAYQTRDLVEAVEKNVGIKLSELKVDGSVIQNDFLIQFQADILGIRLKRWEMREVVAMGAAYLAGLAVGFWKNREEIKNVKREESEFFPKISDEKRGEYYTEWKKAVSRILKWNE